MSRGMLRSTLVPWELFLVRLYHIYILSQGRLSFRTWIDPSNSLDIPILLTIAVNALVILTTIHAQGFYDEVGDRLQGRRTLPIVGC
jgi:hypothetical protein